MPSLRAVLPAAAAAAVVLLAGILYCLGYREQYHALAEAWGAAPFRTPFLDMHAVTAAVECHRLGFDVYVQDPCDVFGRVHGYSPVWLWLAVLPITTAWDNALGLGLVLLFLVALAFLPAGRDWRQTMLITLGAVSSATMFALERANVDLLMFVMAMLAVRLRTTGYAVSLLAGMLKFYPIVLLVLAVRERLVTCLVVWAVAAGVIALWFALDGAEILRGMANIPLTHPFDDNVFGAHNLPFGLAELLGLPHACGDCAAGAAAGDHARRRGDAGPSGAGSRADRGGEPAPAGRQRSAGELFRDGAERVVPRNILSVRAAGAGGMPARDRVADRAADVEQRPASGDRCNHGVVFPRRNIASRHLAGARVGVVGCDHGFGGTSVAPGVGVASGRRMEGSICCGSIPSIGINRWRDLGERAQD